MNEQHWHQTVKKSFSSLPFFPSASSSSLSSSSAASTRFFLLSSFFFSSMFCFLAFSSIYSFLCVGRLECLCIGLNRTVKTKDQSLNTGQTKETKERDDHRWQSNRAQSQSVCLIWSRRSRSLSMIVEVSDLFLSRPARHPRLHQKRCVICLNCFSLTKLNLFAPMQLQIKRLRSTSTLFDGGRICFSLTIKTDIDHIHLVSQRHSTSIGTHWTRKRKPFAVDRSLQFL